MLRQHFFAIKKFFKLFLFAREDPVKNSASDLGPTYSEWNLNNQQE